MKLIIVGALFCLATHLVVAGDAIVIGYNSEGIWTAVTYDRSSTPKGGPHYREAAQACVLALRDLRVRAGENLATTKIVGQSDRTGYVAVARGRSMAANKDVTAVGRGNSQAEADSKVFARLKEMDCTEDEQIVYRYFSYGTDSAVSPPAKIQNAHSSTGKILAGRHTGG